LHSRGRSRECIRSLLKVNKYTSTQVKRLWFKSSESFYLYMSTGFRTESMKSSACLPYLQPWYQFEHNMFSVAQHFQKINCFIKRSHFQCLIFIYPCLLEYGIRIITLLCAWYRPHVLGQHLLNGLLFWRNNAIGLSQGGVSQSETTCSGRFKTWRYTA